jgi:hypothetical protein
MPLRVIRTGPAWALIRATKTVVQRASADTSRAYSTRGCHLRLDGSENLLFTMSKAFHKGCGLWLIKGYAHDQSDVLRALERMKTPILAT